MEKTNYISILIYSLILCSCSNLSVNKEQVNSTLSNIQCYKDLVDEIFNEEKIKDLVLNTRESKRRGFKDPLTVEQKFRTIDNAELQGILSKKWKDECLIKLNQLNDLTGIRYIDESIIIIEVDDFERYTVNEQYSSGRTKEIHRIIIANEVPDGDLYRFGTERVVWTQHLGAGWTYEVSQYQTVH